ncbi:MAG: energy-coupling factor ABC transporter permease [Muribaculaceae bacterium]|nr:energy-coupling factor ABC transporter permease [Muribaculaceae bacterium]
MHMADALVSPVVAGVAGVIAVSLIAVSSSKIKKIKREDIVPLMGVLGAFVFAAQMINFSIPGTGSSGHIIGGILLAALIGPWAGFITLCSVLIIQCLVFADGGLMALGCNIINMAAMSCLVAAPLIYRPIAGKGKSIWRITLGAILASVVGLELGAVLVTVETELSGVTALPAKEFLGLMTLIHLAIGALEGVATAVVLSFVASYKPDMLYTNHRDETRNERGVTRKTKIVLTVFAIVAFILAIGFTWLASGDPDGLEWSIARITGDTELGPSSIPATALLPDYDSTFAGIIGGVIVMVLLWSICAVIFKRKKQQ